MHVDAADNRKSVPLWGTELRFVDCPTRSLVHVFTELPSFPIDAGSRYKLDDNMVNTF